MGAYLRKLRIMTNQIAAVEVTEIVFPEHANHYGTLFGGNALLLMSKAAFLAARAFAKSDVVMASLGDAQFLAPVPVGSVLRLRAWVTRVGRTSLTVSVTGSAEQLDGEAKTSLKGLFEMVVVDKSGRPVRVRSACLQQEHREKEEA
jgi:acyl-CoA thioesterase YciA